MTCKTPAAGTSNIRWGIQGNINISHPFQIICPCPPAGVFILPSQIVPQRMFEVGSDKQVWQVVPVLQGRNGAFFIDSQKGVGYDLQSPIPFKLFAPARQLAFLSFLPRSYPSVCSKYQPDVSLNTALAVGWQAFSWLSVEGKATLPLTDSQGAPARQLAFLSFLPRSYPSVCSKYQPLVFCRSYPTPFCEWLGGRYAPRYSGSDKQVWQVVPVLQGRNGAFFIERAGRGVIICLYAGCDDRQKRYGHIQGFFYRYHTDRAGRALRSAIFRFRQAGMAGGSCIAGS
jgi:hypothetical protein